MTFEMLQQFPLQPPLKDKTIWVSDQDHDTEYALSPISSIPPEILLEIFKICISWCYDYRKPRSRLAWTNVCSSWRNTALSSPRLWQCIDLCDIHMAREFIIRSKGTPVSIISSSPANFHSFDLKIDPKFLTTIDVILFPDDMRELFTEIGRHMVSLEDLTLKVPFMSLGLNFDFELPSLRRLMLEGVSIAWDQCKNLTHLSLRRLTWEYSPSTSQLCDILLHSPNLEVLRLERISPARDESIENIENYIHLHKLRELFISDKMPIVAAVTSRIRVSSETHIQLHFTTLMILPCIFPSGLPYMAGECPHISCLRLEKHGGSLHRPTVAWSTNQETEVISFGSAFCIVAELMNDIREIVDIVKIETLELCPGALSNIQHSLLCEFLWNMKGLKTIRVAFNDIGVLLQVLCATVGSSERMVCPQLRILSFSNLGNTWVNFEATWMDRILYCLSQRKKYGSPVQVLGFGHFVRERTKTMELFSGVVEKVDLLGSA
ncbi:hypothetical protein BDQ17DRAFT_1413911 [Cyathus striatus]|nr:hypothetical protein BDQ17DRAFT_1413911 [Cyathus striatus]